MEKLYEIIQKIAAAPTVSGNERVALPVIRALLSPYTDNIHCDRFGNIKAVFGDGRIFLDAHLDKINMVVTGIDECGFLRVAPVGNVDARTLPAGSVTVLGKETLFGVVTSVPPHLASEKDAKFAHPVEDLTVDLGLSRAEAEKLVQPGDRVLYRENTVMLNDRVVCSPYLDNSVGVAVLCRAAEILAERDALDGVTLCFSAQEETGLRGAAPAVFGCDIDRIYVVDVSFAAAPGIRPEKSGRMGAGPMIGFSPVLDADFSRALRELAEREEIPYSCEVMGRTTGTNADVMSAACGGFATALLSVPIRNMHTPSETADLRDIEQTALLIALDIMKGRAGA